MRSLRLVWLACLPLLWAPLGTVAANADITQASLEQLLEVTIVGASKYEQKQGEVAAAASVITRDEIRAFGWRSLDEALASLPGIHATYDRQYQNLGTRGFGLPGDFNTRLLITINGNRINEAVYDAALSGRAFPLDLELVERIEFIPGPGGAVYGQNALLGVINVVTRSGAAVNGAELSAHYQDRHAARVARATWGGLLDNGLDMLLSATAMKAEGEDYFYDFGSAGVAGVASGMDGEKDEELFTHLARGAWSFDFSYGDRRKNDPTAQFHSVPLMPGNYQRDRHLLTQLQYQDGFAGDSLQLSARLFLGRERYRAMYVFDHLTPFRATRSSDWHGVEARLLSTAIARHKLMLGVEVQDNSRQDQTAGHIDIVSPHQATIHGSEWRGGVYVQDEWSINDTVSSTLGLRVDRNRFTGSEGSPRVALIWRVTPDTSMKALYGRAHRAPNAYERDYDDGMTRIGNPELDGETINTLEFVAEHRVTEHLQLRGSLYRWNMKGLVVLGTDPVSGRAQYQSGDDVKATGVELSANSAWEWGGRLRASFSYQDVAYDGGVELDNSPHVLAKLGFSAPLAASGLRMGCELQYYGNRQAIDGRHLDGYLLSNLNLSAAGWWPGLEVSLGLYNLLDERYVHPASGVNWQNSIEQDGRSARLMVSYTF